MSCRFPRLETWIRIGGVVYSERGTKMTRIVGSHAEDCFCFRNAHFARVAAVLLITTVPLVFPAGARADFTGITGGGLAHENMQPSMALNYIIALTGIYPPRDGGAVGAETYLGEVDIFAGNFAPRGYALCEGQSLPINQYQALYSLLGTTYGGDGRITFALPDLRGRVPIGPGQGAGLSYYALGDSGGVQSVVLSEAQMPVHDHALPSGGSTTSDAGGGQPHTNMQPFLGLNYVIHTDGYYPPHDGGGAAADYIGSLDMFAGNFAPGGTALTNGQLLPIAQNTALFSILGTTYGGDGITTFGLPDLQGRAAIHEGTGPGLTPRPLGSEGGVEAVALTESEMPMHDHTVPPSSGTTDVAGGSQPHTSIQPYTTVNYIIALEGVYPSRNGGNGYADMPFLGEVDIFVGNYAPGGWAFCDGQLLPINQYDALFSLLGTTYGGDGATTFALPDLRGRSIIGTGQGPGLPYYSLGQITGSETALLTTLDLPSHQHEYASPIPEPAAMTLSLVGLVTLAARRNRDKRGVAP